MIAAQRIATIATATAIGFAAMTMPAMATSKHWTKAQCTSYQKSFDKKYPHGTKTQKASGNKTLKSYGCTITVK
jgi:hypothetical protein